MAQEPLIIGDRLRLEDDDGNGFTIVLNNGDPSALGRNEEDGTVAYDFNTGKFYKKLTGDDLQWDEGIDGPPDISALGNVPFCLSNGSDDNIPLVAGKVPFCLANGSDDNIELVP